MVKIKTRKIMDFTELVRWAWQEKQRDEHFKSNLGKGVYFDIDCTVTSDPFLSERDLFTIEVEEKMTDETEVPTILMISEDDSGERIKSGIWNNDCIANLYDSNSLAFYMVHPDGTTTLLWTKEGGIVDGN